MRARAVFKSFSALTWPMLRPERSENRCSSHKCIGALGAASAPHLQTKTVPNHPSKKWHRCDRRSDRAFITTNAKLRFLTFRLTLKRTGRDKKLETIFSFLRSTVFCLCKWRCARHVRRRTKCATQVWSTRSRHREHCLNEERRLCPMHALSCVCDAFFFPSRACALQNH